MDTFGDGKVLLCLLVCLAASSASCSGQPSAGYDYKAASQGGGLNTILKAVLAHESTGHGLHAGSISGHSNGHQITVTKQAAHGAQSSGYSYSGGQQAHAHQRMKDIRVFHKSLGATGNIQPQGYGSSQGYSQQQGQGAYNAGQSDFADSPTPNPSHSLRYIHEAALARPCFFLPTVAPPEATKSGYSYNNAQQSSSSNGYQYQQPSNQAFQDTSNQVGTQGGYQYQNPGQAFQALTSHLAGQGYSYPSPAPTPSSVAEQIAISHYVSSAVQPANQGYRYDKPRQEPADVLQYIQASNSNGYQYPRPETQENAGYHYDRPSISFDYDKPAVTKSTFKGQSYLPLPSAGRPQPTPQSNGYVYDRPSERPATVFKGPSYLPVSPASGGW